MRQPARMNGCVASARGRASSAPSVPTVDSFSLGVAAAMSNRTQLKVELLDTYQNKPPLATIQKNDVAILVAVVYKM